MDTDVRLLTRRLLVTGVILFGLSSCGTRHTQAADEFFIGYARGAQFETTVPLMLMWVSDGTEGRRQALVVPPDVGIATGGRLHSSPPARDPHTVCNDADGCAWSLDDVIGVIPAGSLLKITRIEYSHGLDWWYGKHEDLTPYATVLSGGKHSQDVEIADLSTYSTRTVGGKNHLVPSPDPRLLRPVSSKQVSSEKGAGDN